MEKIGLISDTHGFLNNKILEIFKNTNLIIHAGDIGNINILYALKTIAPIKAVYGNMDNYEIQNILKEEIIFKIENFKIHLSHNKKIINNNFDIIINGHTHIIRKEKINETLYLNPGSATKSRYGEKSVLILNIDKNDIKIETYFL